MAFDANLGTLLRTCDAVGACIAVPDTGHYRRALDRGDTLDGRRPCIHWLRGKERWVAGQRERGWRIVADVCVEIPMGGAGRTLNVAVAGSLVLYKLAGLV